MGMVNYNSKINIISPDVDFAIWLISLTAIIYTTVFSISSSSKISKRRASGKFICLWLIFPLVIEIISSLRWILNGFDGIQPFSNATWNLAFLELQATNIFQPILPRLFVLFSAAWLLRLLLIPYEKTADRFVTGIRNFIPPSAGENHRENKFGKHSHKIILSLSVIMALFIGIYSYLPALNPSSLLVSVDVNFYYTHMENSVNLDISSFLSNIIQQDRVLFLVFQQVIVSLTGSTDLAIRVIPAILGVLLTISVYYFVSISSNDRYMAALAALFTATSFQIVAGINAGFYANWLALIELNIFLALFLKAIEHKRKISRYSIVSTILLVLILFTHSATWIVVLGSLITYAIITFTRRTLKLREAIIIGQIILVNIITEIIKNNIFQSQSTTQIAQSMTPQFSFSNLLQVFRTLNMTFTYFLGGAYANPIAIILATIGLFLIAKKRQNLYQILIAITIVCSLGTFVTSSAFPEIFQSRFIYLVPFSVLAAIGFRAILNAANNFFDNKAGAIGKAIPIMIQIIIFASLLSYALRIVGYVYTL
jgi:hypothetical protein|tara:strand:+ start:67 stop:1686 length:1620 start_codon:yes stop_codon:yes gene_type:complete